MSILTTISGIPLFSTVSEATSWASRNFCEGYHVHNYQGHTGYMGCANHQQTTNRTPSSRTPSTNNRTVNRSVNRRRGGY